MVERFLADFPEPVENVTFSGITFGAPGLRSDIAEANNPQILDFQHVGDLVGGFIADGGEVIHLVRPDLWHLFVNLEQHDMNQYLTTMTALEDSGLASQTDGYRGVDGRGVVVGTSNNDGLDSSSESAVFGLGEIFAGGSGADIIEGGNGNDLLAGGSGNDALLGEDGDDYLFGGNNSDFLIGGKGDDYLLGGYGNDVFVFEDRLIGNDGADVIGGDRKSVV